MPRAPFRGGAAVLAAALVLTGCAGGTAASGAASATMSDAGSPTVAAPGSIA